MRPLLRGQACILAAVNSWSIDFPLEIDSLMATTCNCYALLKRQSRCAFGDNIGRLLVNFDYGSLIPHFSAPGNHGDSEKNGIALLVA